MLTLSEQTNIKGGYFLQDDVGLFDPSFFGLSADMAAVSHDAHQSVLSQVLAVNSC